MNIEWCEEYLRIPEGRFVGKPLEMAQFMRDDFEAIYDNPYGTRRAIISRGRKNAKSFEAAIIVLLHLCGREYKPNSQLFSAAQSREQAAVVFNLAAKMVRLSSVLNGTVVVKETAKQLICPELGTMYRALSAEATTAFGLSPAVIIHDELGQVRGPRSPLYEALETATAAQENPLSIIISTQAPTDSDLLSTLIDDAMGKHDPKTVLRLQTADPDLDPFTEKAIKMANPAYEIFMNKEEVKSMAENARRMPARQSEYENLVLNRRVEVNNPFVSPTLWKTCGAAPLSLMGVPVFGGLDLSSVADLTALVLIGAVNGVWQVHPTFWLPGNELKQKSSDDRVPYDQWSKEGLLIAAPGKSVDYEYVATWLYDAFQRYDIKKLAFDRWNFRNLKPWLLKAGLTEQVIEEKFVEFGQGFQSMSPAMRALEEEILNGRLAHGNHKVLTMCAANAVVQTDPTGNRKLTKAKSPGRIDGMVALAMAMGVAKSMVVEPERKYQIMIY